MQDIQPCADKNLGHQKHMRGLIYAGLLVLLLLLSILSAYYFQNTRFQQERITAENKEFQEMTRMIEHEVLLASSYLTYFSQSSLAQSVLQDHDPEAKRHLTDLMLKFISAEGRFGQIRLLDSTGQEVIRINHRPDDSPLAVPESQLQDKSDRNYFRETSKLAPGQIYTSPFDLNIEHDKIERPLKPVIRFAMPIHNEAGTLLGVGIANYLGNQLFSKLQKVRENPHDSFSLLTENGFCIKGENLAVDSDFIFHKDQPPPFSQKHPQVWAAINLHQTGEIINDQGHFFFKHIDLVPPPPFHTQNKQSLTLIRHMPHDSLSGGKGPSIVMLSMTFLLLGPLMGFLGWKLGTYQVHQKHLFHVLEYEATHDHLTGLYNRKVILDILKQNIALATRRNSPLALGYLDVNDLKKMNDELGHEAGDKMLAGAATSIARTIRNSDSVARVGGDEFLIIFPDCTQADAVIVMERIQLHFAGQGLAETGQKWSISMGCTELKQDGDSLNAIIDRADKMMYAHKQLCKCQGDGALL
jgi:diguanylate cyclase (GGDEF)-like protein